MQPARHAYGALLLEQGRVAEAEAVYRADLGLDGTLPRACHHPGNVWALHGYHECLVRLGKQEQAHIIASSSSWRRQRLTCRSPLPAPAAGARPPGSAGPVVQPVTSRCIRIPGPNRVRTSLPAMKPAFP
jgi:hypothetical protein